MPSPIVPAVPAPAADVVIADLRVTADRARVYAEAAHAPNTLRAYAADLRDFGAWCEAHALEQLPAAPQTLGLYLTELADAGAAFSTIRRRIAGVNAAHRARGLAAPSAHPHVHAIVAGIARKNGTRQTRQDALTRELLERALASFPATPRGLRDRTILLLCWAGALRRSELAALDVEDLKFTKKGLLVRIGRSKTDQAGAGADVAIPFSPAAGTCAVRAVKAWIATSKATAGPLFTGLGEYPAEPLGSRIAPALVSRIVQRACEAAGVDGRLSAHSLRAGFITSAAAAGVASHAIARVSRHKSQQVLETYIRPATAFDGAPLTEIFAR